MSLAFLSPPASAAAPMRARSPMERAALAAGAALQERHGWNVPSTFDGAEAEAARLADTVGFADRSSLAKLEIQSGAEELSRMLAQASGVAAPRPGSAARSAGTWWCRVTPERALVLSERGHAHEVAETLAHGTASILDCTCSLAALALVGPAARELLARFCAIDVRPSVVEAGAFRPGSVARTPGYVLVEHERRLLVLVGWALGEYLWQVVADAAPRLGGGPVGAAALDAHVEARDA